MSRPLSTVALAAVCLAGGCAVALAQGAPPLPKMPLPPSAGDPPPKESGRKPQARKTAPRTSEIAQDATARPRTPSRSGNAATGTERPTRYVPEEFDQGGGEGGSRVKPYLGESGRPGLGMRF